METITLPMTQFAIIYGLAIMGVILPIILICNWVEKKLLED